MMLGLLLARAGVDVLVLEKHGDFLRDFRGDTLHPSTLEVMHELDMLQPLLRRPHQEARTIAANVGGETVRIADFGHLPTHCRFMAFMPQWDFLDFVAGQASGWPGFTLMMNAEVTDLLHGPQGVSGVRVGGRRPPFEVHADLVVGADGRDSLVRERAGLPVQVIGSPMDVLWFRLPRHPEDAGTVAGQFRPGAILVMIDRGDYWQCGYVMPKGHLARLQAEGLPRFRERVATLAGMPPERASAIRGWEDVKLLTVRIDRARRWWAPGLLCIGDAAHAMSPAGGVGINLAIQDAVAAANALALPLRERRLTLEDLRRVQHRRFWPTRVTQWLQRLAQDRVVTPVLRSSSPVRPASLARLLDRVPLLQRVPARVIGVGIRPEHVRTPAVPRRGRAVA